MRPARRGGRHARAARQPEAEVKAFDPASRQWRRPYKPIEQLSADEVEAIHEASLKVLRDTGIRVLSPEACGHYRAAGMTVTDWWGVTGAAANCTVMNRLDDERFYELLFERLDKP